MSYKYSFKYIITGNPRVGKSSLLLKFVEGKFQTYYDPTIGVELGQKIIPVDNNNIRINIYDTAGQEKFKSITQQYFHHTAVALIVYDINDRKSYEDSEKWLRIVREQNRDNIPIVLVGNKLDKEHKRQVTIEEAQGFAIEQGLYFYEISTKTGENITRIFQDTARIVSKKIHRDNFTSGVLTGWEQTIVLDDPPNNKIFCCFL